MRQVSLLPTFQLPFTAFVCKSENYVSLVGPAHKIMFLIDGIYGIFFIILTYTLILFYKLQWRRSGGAWRSSNGAWRSSSGDALVEPGEAPMERGEAPVEPGEAQVEP